MGVYNLETVIVSIGENIEASILTVMALKDLNNKNIIAKAINPTHGEILTKIGAFKVMYPEEIAGKILVKQLIENIKVEEIELCNNLKILKIIADEKMIDKSLYYLESLNSSVKIIALNNETFYNGSYDAKYKIKKNDVIALLGENIEIEKVYKDLCLL